MTRVLALADQSKIGSTPQRRFATVGTETPPQRGAALDRNGLSVSAETACRFEPKSPVGNSEICRPHQTHRPRRSRGPSARRVGCRFAPTPGLGCFPGRCEPRPYMRVRLSTTFLRSVLCTWVGEEQCSPWGPGRFCIAASAAASPYMRSGPTGGPHHNA